MESLRHVRSISSPFVLRSSSLLPAYKSRSSMSLRLFSSITREPHTLRLLSRSLHRGRVGLRLYRNVRFQTTASDAAIPGLPKSPSQSRLRRVIGFTALAAFSFLVPYFVLPFGSFFYAMSSPPPTDEQTLGLYKPTDEQSREVEDYINTHPLTLQLRADPAFTESRPHLKIPQVMRERNLTAGTLFGPNKIVVPPFFWQEEGGKSTVSIFYLGSDLSGHQGIVHGGMLATLLDEGLARACFPVLPNGVGVTANLNIDYRKPVPANSYVVLRARTIKVEGRKAWVEGHLESLPKNGEEPVVMVQAKALFIEPSFAKALPSLYKTNK